MEWFENLQRIYSELTVIILKEIYGFKYNDCKVKLGRECTKVTVLFQRRDLVQISLYSKFVQSKEVSNYIIQSYLTKIYQHPYNLWRNYKSKFFKINLKRILLHSTLIVAEIKYKFNDSFDGKHALLTDARMKYKINQFTLPLVVPPFLTL